jgi:hypothetical protein
LFLTIKTFSAHCLQYARNEHILDVIDILEQNVGEIDMSGRFALDIFTLQKMFWPCLGRASGKNKLVDIGSALFDRGEIIHCF